MINSLFGPDGDDYRLKLRTSHYPLKKPPVRGILKVAIGTSVPEDQTSPSGLDLLAGRETTTEVLRKLNYELSDNTRALASVKDELRQSKVHVERDVKVIVRLQVLFVDISSIDVGNRNYQANVVIVAKWDDPTLLPEYSKESSPVLCASHDDLWSPDLSVANLIHPINVRTSRKVSMTVVTETQWIFGMFSFNSNVALYPADVQHLILDIASSRSEEEVVLTTNETEVSAVNDVNFHPRAEYYLYKHVQIGHSRFALSCIDFPAKCPSVTVYVRVRRRAAFYYWNTFMFMFLLTCGLLGQCFVHPDTGLHGDDRVKVHQMCLCLVVIVIILLHRIALPSPGKTLVDTYMMLVFSIVLLLALEGIVVSYVHHNATLHSLLVTAMATIFIILNVVFIVYFLYITRPEQRKMALLEASYLCEQKCRQNSVVNDDRQPSDDVSMVVVNENDPGSPQPPEEKKVRFAPGFTEEEAV